MLGVFAGGAFPANLGHSNLRIGHKSESLRGALVKASPIRTCLQSYRVSMH